MSYIQDNYDLWAAHDAEQERMLYKLPKCSNCGEPIQDEHCYQIDDGLICEHCLNAYYRVDIEDLME